MDVDQRATVHAALGESARLRMVDALRISDRTFTELAAVAGVPGNAAAHHLDVLESAGLIDRRVSEGDHRRRYVRLRRDPLEALASPAGARPGLVLFVCTHNSARSQFAAALWQARTGGVAQSAGTTPADRIHPVAVRAAAEAGFDLSSATPKGYEAVVERPDLVVSVCDRAREAGIPFDAPKVHWSVPDPVPHGDIAAFRAALAEVHDRVDRLAGALTG